MAADKRTLQRDALKLVQAGKLDKAIEVYKAIVKVDPRDASVHNTLGDLYIKQGKKKDGIAEYLEAAALFEKDGFAMRSIAVCQKVIHADAEQWAVQARLADLYAGQKLAAEARQIYIKIADFHDKKGDTASAMEVFRKIANLEPDNLPVRVKLAGMFEKKKQPDKAAEEYVRAAKGYVERKELDTAAQLYVRAFKLSPGNIEARRRLAEFYAQRQDWPVVVGLLETPVAKGSTDAELIVLYAEALTRVNHPRDAVAALEKVQQLEPNSLPVNLTFGRALLKAGEGPRGTEALNRCVSVYLSENRIEQAEGLLREMADAAPEDERVFLRLLELAQKRGDTAAVGQAYLKIADLREKRGQVQEAIQALEKLLEVSPGEAAVARRLAELKAAVPRVEAPPAAPAPSPAVAAPASVTPAPPPAPTVRPAAAAAPPPAAKRPPSPAPKPIEEELVEVNLESEDLAAIVAAGEDEDFILEVEGEEESLPPALDSVPGARAAIARGAPAAAAEYLEEHLGANPRDAEAWQALVEARRALGSKFGVRDALLRLADLQRRLARFEEAKEAYRGALDIDPKNALAARGLAALVEEEGEVAPGPAPAAPAEPEVLEAAGEEELIELPDEEEPPEFGEISIEEETPEVLEEPQAEEVDLSQEVVPGPVELPPAEESAAAPFEGFEDFLEAPAAATAAPEITPPAAPPPPAAEETSFEELGEALEGLEYALPPAPASAAVPEPAAPPAAEPAAAPSPGTGTAELDEFLAEADFYLQQGLLDEAESLYTKLGRVSPGNAVIAAQLEKLQQLRATASAPPAPPQAASAPPAAAAPQESSADFSDFLSDLRLELETQAEPLPPPPPAQDEGGLNEIFQEFQRSVKEQLGEEDYETHYNLGIAYKEMGLMEEAIAEFTLAEKNPVRQMNAVSMIALCLREMGRFDEAARKLRTGISLAAEGGDDQKGFLYDLAALDEQAGRAAEARETLQRLLALDPGYRDVAARVGASAPKPAAGAPSRKKPKVSYL